MWIPLEPSTERVFIFPYQQQSLEQGGIVQAFVLSQNEQEQGALIHPDYIECPLHMVEAVRHHLLSTIAFIQKKEDTLC